MTMSAVLPCCKGSSTHPMRKQRYLSSASSTANLPHICGRTTPARCIASHKLMGANKGIPRCRPFSLWGWTLPSAPSNATCFQEKEQQDSLMTFEPRSKLPAIDFSIRWNLFFKKLNGVTRAQAFHKLRANSCTRKLRANPKSRR